MGILRKVFFGSLTNILIFGSFLHAEASDEVLCSSCLCVKDESTWMPDKEWSWYDSVMSHKSNPNALLVNCSGQHVTPFAGGNKWPDVPMQRSRDDLPQTSKIADVPATRADFSHCSLVGAMKNFPAKETRRLRELSLSHNQLTSIHTEAFVGLPALRYLDLSHNSLADVPPNSLPQASDSSMASNLEVLLLKYNDLQKVPWKALLRLPKLEWLDLSSNYIRSIENGFNRSDDNLVFESIKVLNLKHNQLSYLSIKAALRFPNLEELDLSWNSISVVPKVFLTPTNPTFRNLSVLNLDGNPIKSLGSNSFVGSPFIRRLSLSASAVLSEISNEAFDGLYDLRVLKLRKNILLSRMPKNGILWEVHETGGRWAVEEVDLSYNSLESLPGDFLPWREIKRVNLQGNPWNCNCSLQWMLDGFMPTMYKVDSVLLFDLRCSKPRWLQGRRFVHWLGRSNGVYCGNMMEKLRMGIQEREVEDVGVVAMGMSPAMIAIIVSVTVLVLGLMVLAVIWQRRAIRLEKDLRSKNYQCRNPRY